MVGEPQKTYNLLDLVNGKTELLGSVTLEPGQYSQMRLIISATPDNSLNVYNESHPFANYVVTNDDDIHELKIPSGMQSGIKLVRGFTIEPGGMVDLVLDFNALKSIVKAGASGNWLLKPTIKIIDTMTYAEITGSVFDEVSGEPLEGVLVIAQLNETFGEAEIVQTASVTDENGEYKLLIDPGIYTLAVSLEGYSPITMDVDLRENGGIVSDFVLNPVETGVVTGMVSLNNDDELQPVTISIRIPAVDGGDDEGDENADEEDEDDSKKVKVCHNGHTIVISKSALPAHLAHGDTEGPCDADGNDSGDDSEDGEDEDEDEDNNDGDDDDDDDEDDGDDGDDEDEDDGDDGDDD